MPTATTLVLRRSPRRHTLESKRSNGLQKQLQRFTVKEMADEDVSNVQRQLHLIPAEHNDAPMLDLVTDDMSKAFTFLAQQSRAVLRNIGRKWNRRGTGNKKEFLYRNVLFLIDGRTAGRDVSSMLKDNDACPSYDDFLQRAEETGISFEKCPSRDAIQNHLRSMGDTEDTPTQGASESSRNPEFAGNQSTPNFSISEFARLFVMLRYDHVCKESLLRLTKDLKISDFEAGRTRDSFWKEIERRFNDGSLKYHHSFESCIPEANSAEPPLCYRTIDVLKTQLQNGRKSFTLAYSNYCKSGQNDPDKWPEFLTKDSNGNYVAASKSCYIIFLVCRLDQECGQDMFLLNASTKTFEGGEDEGPENESSTGSAGSKRKRTSADTFNSTMEKRWLGLEKFMNDTRKVGEAIQQSVSTKETGISNDFEDLAERNKVLTMISSAYNAYQDAKQKGADPKLVEFLLENYETAMKKYSELRERSGVAHHGE